MPNVQRVQAILAARSSCLPVSFVISLQLTIGLTTLSLAFDLRQRPHSDSGTALILPSATVTGRPLAAYVPLRSAISSLGLCWETCSTLTHSYNAPQVRRSRHAGCKRDGLSVLRHLLQGARLAPVGLAGHNANGEHFVLSVKLSIGYPACLQL